jgi:cytochrome c oxidase cbb3-type subunit 4
MDLNDLRSAVTLMSFAMFIGLVVWTWQRKRLAAFEEAARLPFEDEDSKETGK